MINQEEITAIGKFQKTHALKGELNAILDISEDYLLEKNAAIVEIDGIYVPFFANSIRPKGSTSYLVKLDGVNSEEEARIFVNKTIFALKSELAPFLNLDEDEIMEEDDLVGYTIKDDLSGEEIGVIDYVDSSTDNLLFIVSDSNEEKYYIPAAEEFIIEIDDEKKMIRMNLPEGLLDLNKTSNI